MKRRAYIGLSSPTAYFYDHKHVHFKKEPWGWNPIFESPQGLITLFDELWFLSRALCPVNLRREPYVKFLDDDSDYRPLIKMLTETFNTKGSDSLISNNPIIDELIDINSQSPEIEIGRFNQVITTVYGRPPGRDIPLDNHSQGIDLCGFGVRGSSTHLDPLVYDIVFLNCLKNKGIKNIELITNSCNSSAFRKKPITIHDIQVSHGITIKRVPFSQTPQGPVIEGIEMIRESKYLIDFRNKILNGDTAEDFVDLVDKIEKEYQNYRNKVLVRHLHNSRIGTSFVRNALSFSLNFVSGAGIVKSIIDSIKSSIGVAKTRKFLWTGFLADIEQE